MATATDMTSSSTASGSGLPRLFSRSSPLPQWDAAAAQVLLQARFGRPWQRQDLLQALIVIQHHFGAITAPAQTWLARHCNTNTADVRALIHFYHFLREDRTAPHRILFSNNIIEEQQGMRALFDELRMGTHGLAEMGLTSCIGLSDQGPAALINGYPLTRLNGQRIREIQRQLQQQIPLAHWPQDWFRVDNTIQTADRLLQFQPDPALFLNQLLAQAPQQVMDQVQQSGLRGLGGAGFPTGRKWQACAEAPGEEALNTGRYVICNADEGEPGTFKDRVLLQHNLDAVLCGMRMCGHAIGARHGILYLRGEYLFLFDAINTRLQQWREQHWLNADFNIEIQLGAGAYVCGEETALLESIEGRRGIPRIKPPFPVRNGLYQQPTVVNNVETFAAAAWLLLSGVDAFRAVGTEQSPGTRLHSVAGDCDKPGIYELPMGASVQDLLQACAARDPALVQLGGPSGVISSPADWQQPLAFEGISPGGSVMVFDASRSHFNIARNFTAFFQQESCGFCTPCRAGTQVLLRDMDCAAQGQQHADLNALASLINSTSHCGLGQTAGRPVLHWLHMNAAKKTEPAHD